MLVKYAFKRYLIFPTFSVFFALSSINLVKAYMRRLASLVNDNMIFYWLRVIWLMFPFGAPLM